MQSRYISDMVQTRRLVTRMLAVGRVPRDQISRLTRGESFTCCYGSEEEHAVLSAFCQALETQLAASGQSLSDFSPDELRAWLLAFAREEGAA